MKNHSALLALIALCAATHGARAQFSWDDEPAAGSAQAVLDDFAAAPCVPALESALPSVSPHAVSLRSAPAFHPRPVTPPSAVVPAACRPWVRADEPLVDDCALQPDVAEAFRASVVSDSTPATGYNRDAACPKFLGRLSANPYAADSTANPYSAAGSPYSPESVNNPYGSYGSPYSSESARNPYATDAPKIIAQDGTYLGKLSDNPYDPDSVANPYGRYGSPYSPTSIKNPYSTYGSPYSPQSPNNPYATQAPLLFGE